MRVQLCWYSGIGALLCSIGLVACGSGGGAVRDPDAGEVEPDAGPDNLPPIARAGADQIVERGVIVTLDGTSSSDPEGSPLTYAWWLTQAPADSLALLDDPTSPVTEFLPDRAGTYFFGLRVSDGEHASELDLVRVTLVDSEPVAAAGNDRIGWFGDNVYLDGYGSTDPDGQPLTFLWTMLERPAGATADFVDPTSSFTSFHPDAPGIWRAQLVVTANGLTSAPDEVMITIENAPPDADAGDDGDGVVGVPVMLDGTGSSDLSPVTFAWAVTGAPTGAAPALADADQNRPTFTTDLAGLYTITLTVSDGFASDSDDVRILVAEVGEGEVVILAHDISDAEYSRALDRIVATSDETGDLHLIDPTTAAEVVVDLPHPPISVSVSPSGLEAVVAHTSSISLVDLVGAVVTSTVAVSNGDGDVVHGGNGHAYVLPATGGWVNLLGVDLTSGEEVLGVGIVNSGGRARVHPTQPWLYLANRNLSPSDIEKHDIATGAPAIVRDSPYHGEYEMCGNLWFSPDGGRVYTACANVFRSTANPETDMTYVGALFSIHPYPLFRSIDHGNGGAVAAMRAPSWGDDEADVRLDLYDATFLDHLETRLLPSVPIGGDDVPSRGRFVFFDAAGDDFVVIVTATPPAGGLTRTGLWRSSL